MKKTTLFFILGIVCLIASAVMYSFVNDSHLSELGDAFWVPLPLAGTFLLLASKTTKKAE
jgi:CDP-diglyceride synthetase